MVAYLFAGQGSQYIGMGKDLYENFEEARKIFDSADQLLGFKLSEICFLGPENLLMQTINSQPAIFTVSIACLEVFRKMYPSWQEKLKFVAGLSLGEYSALVAANALEFGDALRLVRKRAEFMDEACKKNPGGMLTILGLDLECVKEICKISETEIANINCPGQVVISGKNENLRRAEEIAKEKQAKTIFLKVSGAFHSSLMKEASIKLKEELDRVKIKVPDVAVVSNVDARPTSDPSLIKEKLIKQISSSVFWYDSIRFILYSGINRFIEFGPGRVLSGLMRRIEPKAEIFSIENSQDLSKFSFQFNNS